MRNTDTPSSIYSCCSHRYLPNRWPVGDVLHMWICVACIRYCICLFQLFITTVSNTSLEEIRLTSHLLQLCLLLTAVSFVMEREDWDKIKLKKCWHCCLFTHIHPPPPLMHYYCHDATMNCIELTRGYAEYNEKLKQLSLRGSKAWRWNSQESNVNGLVYNSNSSRFSVILRQSGNKGHQNLSGWLGVGQP